MSTPPPIPPASPPDPADDGSAVHSAPAAPPPVVPPDPSPDPFTLSPAHPLTPSSLSPRELELLASFLQLNFNLTALADRNNRSPAELIAFANSPAVNAALTGLRRFRTLADHLAHADERREACAKLVTILRTSTDEIEQRKAAACLLRNTTPPQSRATDFVGSGTKSVLPTHRADRASDVSGSAATSVLPANGIPSPLDPSVPRSLGPSPRPDSNPELLLAHLARAFNPLTGDASVAISHLQDALAPDATINGLKPPRELSEFRRLTGCRDDKRDHTGRHPLDLAPLAPLKEALALVPLDAYPGEFSHQQTFIAVHPDGDTDHVHFRLEQLKPSRWRITAINTRRGAERHHSRGMAAARSSHAPPTSTPAPARARDTS